MLFGVMKILALTYYWTWFLWPFVLVFSLGSMVTNWIKKESPPFYWFFLSGLSLLLILAGITAPLMSL